MNAIIKTISASADLKIVEEYATEQDAQNGEPVQKRDVEVSNYKIQNVKYKLKDLIKNDWIRCEDHQAKKKVPRLG